MFERDERIGDPPIPPSDLTRDASISEIARKLVAYGDISRDGQGFGEFIEALASVELDIGIEPSHHRTMLARVCAWFGFCGVNLPPELDGALTCDVSWRTGWDVATVYQAMVNGQVA